MLRINFLSRLTLILCTYITVVPCFTGNKIPFTPKHNRTLIRKTDVKTKTEILLENLAKVDDTIIIQPKEIDNPESDSKKTVYTSIFADNGAAL